MSAVGPQPPRWADRLLEWYCRPSLLEDLQGDLYEYFYNRLDAGKPLWYAKLCYIIDVLKFFRLYTLRKPRSTTAMNHFALYKNYFKSSARNLARNKVFTGINILGLAVSMSVGLLVIAFLADLSQYDRFHEKGERIYRINNRYAHPMYTFNCATSSVFTHHHLRDAYTGYEELLLMRQDFGADLQVGEKVVPMTGFWSGSSFFELFSFELLQGNPATALAAPNSMVITQKMARKLFGEADPMGQVVLRNGETPYTVTGVMRDIPYYSHLQFEALGSLITLEQQQEQTSSFYSYRSMFQNYVYVLLPEQGDAARLQAQLDQLSASENAKLEEVEITYSLQALPEITPGKALSNQPGPTMDTDLLYILIGLAAVIIISACFNYTNLSLARALRRSKEVGIRKYIGASRGQVFGQFITEAVIISLLAVIIAYGIYEVIKPFFLNLDGDIQRSVRLVDRPLLFILFGLFGLAVGWLAGFVPGLVLSKLNASKVLRNAGSVRVLSNLSIRKALVVFQFVVSLAFICSASISWRQYQHSLAYELGFATDNIVNVALQGNEADLVAHALEQVPGIQNISRSLLIPATGTLDMVNLSIPESADSGAVYCNTVDHHYLELHNNVFVAGQNFEDWMIAREDSVEEAVIVNEYFLKRFNLGTPGEAIGKQVVYARQPLSIIGVVQDFHYASLSEPIESFVIRGNVRNVQYLNLELQTNDVAGTMQALQEAWQKLDPVHEPEITFYSESIQAAYKEYATMYRVIGFLAMIACSIAMLGLLGMAVYSTESRLREISIRKVFGAGEWRLILLMGRGYVLLLFIAALIAVPLSYFFYREVVLSDFAYAAEIGLAELLAGALLVIGLGVLAIAWQTARAARVNPATLLRND